MIGAIAEAYYGPVAPDIAVKVRTLLPDNLRPIIGQFCRRYGLQYPQPLLAPL